jgi:ribosome-associated protein
MPYIVSEFEVEFVAIRAQGPGGQHVNKASTAVQLRFDIDASGLPADVKARLRALADSRISGDGIVVIKAQGTRSQDANRLDALARLQALIARAEQVDPPRKPTRPSYGARQRRLAGKAQRSELKAGRSKLRP